jgi:hypothetical protein
MERDGNVEDVCEEETQKNVGEEISLGNKAKMEELTPCSRVSLVKPPVAQLLKNFPKFYGTRVFITVFTKALHWSLS